jgi:hypothetical protein
MVDPSRIEEKFRQLDGFLEVLRQLGEIPPAELAGDGQPCDCVGGIPSPAGL